jgi:GTPase SAR1 family protein
VQPNDEAKLLLVGEGNVGKTSLINALRGQPFVEGRETTHGIEINTVEVVIKDPESVPTVRLRTWDFGGQEVYRITHQFFFSSRSVYLVVWRPREGKDENAVESWINRIRLRVGQEAKVIVVATHGDERRAELDWESLRQRFGAMLSGFSVVDNKSGNGIEQLREIVGAIAGALPQIGEPVNVQWKEARDALLSRTETHIKRSTFDRICAAHELEEDEADTFARLLADLGYIVYFPDDDGLKDIIVLQPEMLTKAISYVLEDSATADAGGVIDHSRLGEIWSVNPPHLPTHLHRYMLRLMEKFDVSYRIPDTDKSLVGQLVPYERPKLDWLGHEADHSFLEVECEFGDTIYGTEQSSVGDLPGLIAWLIVRNHRFATGKHWRNGVVLRHPEYGTEGLYELLSPTVLRLRVRGEARGFFFDILRDTLTYLLDTRWPGLAYHLYVPCPSRNNEITGRCRGRFPLRSLERLRERADESVTCLECLDSWDIAGLLTGFRTREQYSVGHLLHAEISALRGSVEQALLSSRATFQALASEVNDCPRLFSVFPHSDHWGDPRKAFTQQFRLTLWCEEPGAAHPVNPYYKFRKPREWFADAAPYLQIAAKTVALLAPGVGNASAVFSGEATDAKRISDFMKSLADASGEVEQGSAQPGQYGLTRREGAAIRRFRELLLELDPVRNFAGLRRILAPTGDFLWVCPAHHSAYEPGLPKLPSVPEVG